MTENKKLRLVIEFDPEEDKFTVETGNMSFLDMFKLMEHVKMQAYCQYYDGYWKDNVDPDEDLFN